MSLIRIYGLFLRHFYLITRSFPRILDLIYWPSIQITLWGFISNFFAIHSAYYNNAVGVILSCAILYDFLFRTSIGFNMLFLEEIWSRNFTNLFIAPIKISEIIVSLVFTALIRALIGLVPAILLTSPLFGISLLDLGIHLFFLFLSLYVFGITLGILVSAGLLRHCRVQLPVALNTFQKRRILLIIFCGSCPFATGQSEHVLPITPDNRYYRRQNFDFEQLPPSQLMAHICVSLVCIIMLFYCLSIKICSIYHFCF